MGENLASRELEPNRFLVASDSACPCGAVRSAHLPVKEKAASSNLVRGARHRPAR